MCQSQIIIHREHQTVFCKYPAAKLKPNERNIR